MHDLKPSASAQGVACCDVVDRGPVLDGGRLFFNTLDAHIVALDAATGRELWKTKLGEISKGETITMAPLVVKGRVLVGNSGGNLVCAAGSRPLRPRPARSPGGPTAPAPTATS
jgi:alcohol dehydrogenase (cytochrome c)